jgi:hypothetical protein
VRRRLIAFPLAGWALLAALSFSFAHDQYDTWGSHALWTTGWFFLPPLLALPGFAAARPYQAGSILASFGLPQDRATPLFTPAAPRARLGAAPSRVGSPDRVAGRPQPLTIFQSVRTLLLTALVLASAGCGAEAPDRQGLSCPKVAAEVGVPWTTVKSWLWPEAQKRRRRAAGVHPGVHAASDGGIPGTPDAHTHAVSA